SSHRHSLSKKERLSYINAVKCTQTKKGITKNQFGIKQFTIFEDFAFEHAKQTPYVHLVGHFLSWHRYILKTFETALREQCGYDGAQPYWDYALDYNKFAQSPIWDATYGFGGNGFPVDLSLPNPNAPGIPGYEYRSGGGCVMDGPFKNYIIRLPRRDLTVPEPRCIERAWNIEYFQHFMHRSTELQLYTEPTFTRFLSTELDKIPDIFNYPPGAIETINMHTAFHLSIGGTEADGFMSPFDPLFYMLHANMDRIWRRWQSMDPEVRHNEYGGTDIPAPIIPIPDPDPYGMGWLGVNITADFKITLSGLAGPIAVEKMQDTTSDYLCYDYDTTYKPLV
ncbi:Di-copper centre-containing protein, partial [Ascobolus immersus RN42]